MITPVRGLETGAAMQRRRIGAYGMCWDESGRLLLVRASPSSVRPGCWLLPGGGIEHGEHPVDAVVRELAEETGLAVTVTGLRDVVAEVVSRPPGLEHTDGIVYDLAVTGGDLRAEQGGSSDGASWLAPAQARRLPLSGLAARVLGAAGPRPAAPDGAIPADQSPLPARGPQPRRRGQRFAAYGLVTDPAGRVLLTLIAAGYPGAGRWHLPGGGSDFGEQPRDALRREVIEETGQQGDIGELLGVTHLRNPAALGPEGHPIDWHGVRAVFRMTVNRPTSPEVLDKAGSTEAAAWFTPVQAAGLPLTELAEQYLAGDGSTSLVTESD